MEPIISFHPLKRFKSFLSAIHLPRILVALSLLLLTLVSLHAPMTTYANGCPAVVYVNLDAAGANNGTSWADAYTDLQSALTAVCPGHEIWVAQGTYYPTSGSDRTVTFQLVNGVGVYGGFGGYETLRSERDYKFFVTILSGDIGTLNDNGDNSNHVVTGSGTDSTAILDGFTVSGGNGDQGGGLRNVGGSPLIVNVIFENNLGGSFGGGIYNSTASSPTLINVIIRNNYANRGGGISNSGISSAVSDPILFNVILSNNSSTQGGGGIWNSGNTNPQIINTTFFKNQTGSPGSGGMGSQGADAKPKVRNTIMWKDFRNDFLSLPISEISDFGGASTDVANSNIGAHDPQFVDENNNNFRLQVTSPDIDAGDYDSIPVDTHDLDGDSDTTEVIPYDLDNLPRFVDEPAVANTGAGTLVYLDLGAHEFVRLLSVDDITHNEGNSGTTSFDFTVSLSAPALAGGVCFDIETNEGQATIGDNDYDQKVLAGQCIAESYSTYSFIVDVNGDTNVEDDELFYVNLAFVSGNAVLFDERGIGTILNDDATQAGPNFVVNSAADTNDGACDLLGQGVGNQDCTLREAIHAANADPVAHEITFVIPDDAGAFCSADNICTITLVGSGLPTIDGEVKIDGSQNDAHITIDGADSYRVFDIFGSADVTLDTLTITKGRCNGCGGAGIQNQGTLEVIDSTFSNNWALSGGDGGGILNENSGSVSVSGSTFVDNLSENGGGAISSNGSSLFVVNSTFDTNFAHLAGGAIHSGSGVTLVQNSTVANNGCVISCFSAGGVSSLGSAMTTLENTIVSNNLGGDCYTDSGGINADAFNIDSDDSCHNATLKTLAEINLQGLADNGGPTETMALGDDSDAIDTGDNDVCDDDPGPNNLDQRGETRPYGVQCDVGAFELTPTPQTGPNFVVNDAADTDDGSCDLAPGNCTLREAVNAANAAPVAHVITFDIPDDAGAACSADNICTITLALSGLPSIVGEITIDGSQNSAEITIDGANAYRVFDISGSADVTLDTLTITKGSCISCSGAGIQNQGILNVIDSSLISNIVQVTGDGGGIYNFGSGSLTVSGSTFYSNRAPFGGGGIASNGSSVTVVNSTFSNNLAQVAGGGIHSGAGTTTVINSTIVNNHCSFCLSGGGISSLGTAATTLYNTLVSDSEGGNCFTDAGSISADSYNMDSDGTCHNATQKTIAQINQLGHADNGGPTKTNALGALSHAIDAGDDAVCDDDPGPNNLDQRGNARNDLHCDVGAFEFVEADGNSIFKDWENDNTSFTFGPTLAKMLLNTGSPLRLQVTRTPGGAPPGSPPANALPILWDASTTQSQFSLTATLCYDPTGLTPAYENSLRMWHYNGSSWDNLGGTLDTLTHDPYHCVTATTPLTSLSPLILAPNAPTAVDVNGVKAKVNAKGNVVVTWKTTSESQVAGFKVYPKRGKGKLDLSNVEGWQPLTGAMLQAKKAGSVEGSKYRFADKTVKSGKRYRYQIEVIYLDNHSEFTKIVRVKTK